MHGKASSILTGILLGAGAVACTNASEPVPVVPPTLAPSARGACATVADNLPESVGEDKRRSTRPPLGVVAAWGDPPVVLRCGVGRPADYRPDAQVLEVDGVTWFPEPEARWTTFTAVDREVFVEVVVPTSRPADAVLVELAPALRALPDTVNATPSASATPAR